MPGAVFPFNRFSGTATSAASTAALARGTHFDDGVNGFLFSNTGAFPILVGFGEDPTATAYEAYVGPGVTVDLGVGATTSFRVITASGSSTYSMKGHN